MFESVATHIGKGIAKLALSWARGAISPRVKDVVLGGLPPECVGTLAPARSLLTDDPFSDTDPGHYLGGNPKNGWVGKLTLRFRLVNESNKAVSVVGIDPGKTSIKERPASSIMFPPQGSISGDAVRFECNLDRDCPSMKRFELSGSLKEYRSSEYYFDEGAVVVRPGEEAFFRIDFLAKRNSYLLKPYLRYRTGRGERFHILEIPLPREGRVYQEDAVMPIERFVRSYERNPPYIVPRG